MIQSSDGPRAIVVPVSWPEDEEALRKDIVTRTNCKRESVTAHKEQLKPTMNHFSRNVPSFRKKNLPTYEFLRARSSPAAVIDESWEHLSGGVAFLKAEEVPRTVLGKHLKRQMKHL